MWSKRRINTLASEQAWRYGVLILFIGLALILHGKYLTRLPWGFHNWAQVDRLALALSFYDYNFDFFHSRTLSLRTVDGVTGVEPPVQAYLASLLGLVVGCSRITIAFRCLDLVMMVVGFWFLFRLVFESTGRVLAGLFLVEALPIKFVTEYKIIWEKVRSTWSWKYLTPTGYALIKICLRLMGTYALIHWRRTVSYLPLILLLGMVVELLLYVLSGLKPVAHDMLFAGALSKKRLSFSMLQSKRCYTSW
jgi:hypothetical protein